MPPRGSRKRASNEAPSHRRAPSPEPASQEPSEISSGLGDHGPPFYNTTFSTHRVSPLHIGPKPLDQERLSALAKRLRDLLVGDVVRGVEVGLDSEDGVMARAGALEAVDLSWSSVGSIIGIDSRLDTSNEIAGRPVSRDLGSDIGAVPDSSWDEVAAQRRLTIVSGRQALHVSLRYESVLCTALLLPELHADGDQELEDEPGDSPNIGNPEYPGPLDGLKDNQTTDPNHFRSLPLLLLRMPTPLRTIIVDFIASTFDCRISNLGLGTRTLLTNLERWIAVSKGMRGSLAAKDVVLTLGFSPCTPFLPTAESDEPRTADQGLKAIDVIISAAEIQKFRDIGTKLKSSDRQGRLKRKREWAGDAAGRGRGDRNMLEEGWEWMHRDGDRHDFSAGNGAAYPFTEALGSYVDEHLALNLFDPKTKITKVACGAFAMSEGRLKLFSPLDKDAGRGSGLGASTDHILAVVDCLSDLLDRAMVRL